MLQDRFVKIMLVVIAALLAANLFQSSGPAVVESTAHAQQDQPTVVPNSQGRVSPIGGFRVTDLRDVVAVGDGRSFVVANPTGFQVYRVEEIIPARR